MLQNWLPCAPISGVKARLASSGVGMSGLAWNTFHVYVIRIVILALPLLDDALKLTRVLTRSCVKSTIPPQCIVLAVTETEL